MRNVCNSKSHLQVPHFSIRARVDALRFRSQVGISFVLLLRSHFLESVGHITHPDSRWDAYGLNSQVLGFLGLQALCTLPLTSEAPLGIECSNRPNDCRRKGLRSKQTGSSHPQDFDAEDGMSGIVLTTASLR